MAGIQLNFEWDPNPEPDIAGYRVFSRLAGEAYDYDHPDWEGQDAFCSLWIDNEEADYFFVVRAYDTDGFESDDSNEVAYTPPEDPPAEDPPSEDPPAEDPPVEDPPTLNSVTISGPAQVNENSGAQYVLTGNYSDGSSRRVTDSASWNENSWYASINSNGYLTVRSVASDKSCMITASYGGQSDTHHVLIVDDPPPVDPPAEDPPSEDDPEDLLVIDAVTGWGQVYLYVDECDGAASVDDFAAIDETAVQDFVGRPDDLFLGLIRIELMVEQVGGTTSIPIYFSDSIDDDVQWYTYDDVNGWQDYAAYVVFSDDGMSVTLELKDGGFGDADGVKNGVIKCTSGPSQIGSSNYAHSVSGQSPTSSDSCFIDAISF